MALSGYMYRRRGYSGEAEKKQIRPLALSQSVTRAGHGPARSGRSSYGFPLKYYAFRVKMSIQVIEAAVSSSRCGAIPTDA